MILGPRECGDCRHRGALVSVVTKVTYQRRHFHMLTPCLQHVTAMLLISENILPKQAPSFQIASPYLVLLNYFYYA